MKFELALRLFPHDFTHADACRAGDFLEACGDVHPVAQEVDPFRDHVADIDADAVLQSLGRRQIGIVALQCPLDRDGGAHRLHDACEFDDDAVAGRAENPTAVLADEIGDGGPVNPQRSQRAFLVFPYQAAIAGDICRQYRSEAPTASRFHVRWPPNATARAPFNDEREFDEPPAGPRYRNHVQLAKAPKAWEPMLHLRDRP